MSDQLTSWHDTPTRKAIRRLRRARDDGGRTGLRPPSERIAVYDNDGTLWCEKPMPIGPIKPVRIWSRIGKRPILAAGNSNGDIPMLRYAGGKDRPALRLLLLHDDEDREFAYTTGAETSLELADKHDWTVVSIKNDWSTVFADAAS